MLFVLLIINLLLYIYVNKETNIMDKSEAGGLHIYIVDARAVNIELEPVDDLVGCKGESAN